jgi:hypothetical protein
LSGIVFVDVCDCDFYLQEDFVKAALIGCGSIGGFKPDHIENSTTGVLTHAHAISKYMEPVVCFDIDEEKRNYVKNKWHFAEALADYRDYDFSGIDFVALATPAEKHFAQAWLLFPKLTGKTVLLEKPAGNCVPDANGIRGLAVEYGINVAVNYQRCYLPTYEKRYLERLIGYADRWHFVLHYCRGYHRDASHFFALLQKWGVEVCPFVLHGGIPDYSEKDLTYDAMGGQFRLIAHDGRIADVFQVEIYGPEGRVVFSDHGKRLDVFLHGRESTFGDYLSWATTPEVTIRTGLESGLEYVYKSILESRESFGIEDAVQVWEMMAKGKRK